MNNTVRLELSVLVLLLISGVVIFSKPNITGYVSSKAFTQRLDLTIEKSQEFFLEQQNVTLSSFMITGDVEGKGVVDIYIDDEEGNKLLVYSNAQKTKQNSITGMAAGGSVVLKEGSKLDYYESCDSNCTAIIGKFSDACIDTCTLPATFAVKNKYKVIFLLEPDTKLHVDSISYSVV